MPIDSLTRTAGGVARAALAALAALLLASGACRYPATEALVEVSSNAPRERVLRVSAEVLRAGTDPDAGGNPAAAAWQATAVPASFTVVPRGDGPRDERVLVVIRATLDAGSDPAREPARAFTRAARFSLVPRAALRVALRLNISCGAPASGCTSAGPDACTVSRRCDEQGLTCGDEGTCVSPDVQPEPIDPGHVPGGPSDAAPSDIGPTPDAPPADVAPRVPRSRSCPRAAT